jgi:hypothetical protein
MEVSATLIYHNLKMESESVLMQKPKALTLIYPLFAQKHKMHYSSRLRHPECGQLILASIGQYKWFFQ